MSAPDRLQQLLSQAELTGIDFVYVHEDQDSLTVCFLHDQLPEALMTGLTKDRIHIRPLAGDQADVPVENMIWITAAGTPTVLRLHALSPRNAALYRLSIDDEHIDPYFNDVTFSFHANCPSKQDCRLRPHECPPEAPVDFPVDYQARDFWSFRRALLDFVAQKYPDWADRLEADAGIMLAEVLSAFADEMAYYQDRVGREAYLETASQRRSLRRHARLVDYTVDDARGATAWLDIQCAPGKNGIVSSGTDVWALGDQGRQVYFETGRHLREIKAKKEYGVDAARNTLLPYLWDEEDTCLPAGATSLYVQGHRQADLSADDFPDGRPSGKWVLLQTTPSNPAIPERAWPVRLIGITEEDDLLMGTEITHLVWEQEQALPFEMDLRFLEVRGNLLPAIAGRTFTAFFYIGALTDTLALPEEKQSLLTAAIEREGPNGAPTYLFSLPGSEETPLVWTVDGSLEARPCLHLEEVSYDDLADEWLPGHSWTWRRSLLGSPSSEPLDTDFTLDDGAWRRVVGYQRIGKEIVHQDYAGAAGFTLRFGDGEFGRIPAKGTMFRATYRLGGGRRSNVAEGSITQFTPVDDIIERITNPLPATGGQDPETPETVRQLAPEAFRAVAYRAVTEGDYAEAAERLPWVQKAGAAFRWTGSWLSAFATPDPRDSVVLSAEQRSELVDQLDRFRQAGRETHVLAPHYADLEIEIEVCVEPFAFRSEVEEQVMTALFGRSGIRPRAGYFSPDRFSFGDSLIRSSVEATVQAVPGVRAVSLYRFRRRGYFHWRLFKEAAYAPGMDTIIRITNDPLHPEWGTVKLKMKGGA